VVALGFVRKVSHRSLLVSTSGVPQVTVTGAIGRIFDCEMAWKSIWKETWMASVYEKAL
jgi:hypothetical protein